MTLLFCVFDDLRSHSNSIAVFIFCVILLYDFIILNLYYKVCAKFNFLKNILIEFLCVPFPVRFFDLLIFYVFDENSCLIYVIN